MLKKFNYREVNWIDLESPSREELETIGREHRVHPLILTELAEATPRPHLDAYNDFVYLVLHFPVAGMIQEVDFIIGRDFIVTTHYAVVNPINDFAKIFESNTALKRHPDRLDGGHIFFYVVRELYLALAGDLDRLKSRLRAVEDKVFADGERAVVKTLADLRRELLDYQWALAPQREVLAALLPAGEELLGGQFRYHWQLLQGEYEKIQGMVGNNHRALLDLKETNDSLLTIKNNEIMRVLTTIAFIFLPLNLLAQIFGSSTLLPTLVSPGADFFVVLGLMAVITLISVWLARAKKWL